MQQTDPLLRYRLGDSAPLRLPDMDNHPSAVTVLRSEYTMGSDAAGHCVFGESFNLSGSKLLWTVTAGSTGTATGTGHPQGTAFYADARVARMVAMRVQVTYIGAESTSAGYLSYCEKNSVADADTQTVDALHTGADIQVRATEGLVAYIDYTQTPRWEVPTNATFMQYTFPFALFVASGLPASNVSLFRVKVERFMEYLPIEGSLAEGDTAHEPHNPGALSVHGALSGARTSVYAPSHAAAFFSTVKEVANAAYHVAQPLLPYIVPKARQYLIGAAGKALPAMLAL